MVLCVYVCVCEYACMNSCVHTRPLLSFTFTLKPLGKMTYGYWMEFPSGHLLDFTHRNLGSHKNTQDTTVWWELLGKKEGGWEVSSWRNGRAFEPIFNSLRIELGAHI